MFKIVDKFPMSPYYELYDMLVPKDNKYRRFDELISKYCPDNGRNVIDQVILLLPTVNQWFLILNKYPSLFLHAW